MQVTLNFDDFQTADDGNTIHYGGSIKVNEVEVPAKGTDRDWGCTLDIVRVIENLLGRKLTDDEFERVENAIAIGANVSLEL
jgi:hypothetical protein